MKTGRNELCPCGSGKKYKKCCMNQIHILPAVNKAYEHISKVYQELQEKLEEYMLRHFARQDIQDGTLEFFCLEGDADIPMDENLMKVCGFLYLPWLLFNWVCRSGSGARKSGRLKGITVSQTYMKENSRQLTEEEKKLITAIDHKPFGFFEIMDATPGKSIDLENIMTHERVFVIEYSGSTFVHPGDIVFARTVLVEGIGMIVGMGGTVLPPRMKPGLMEFKRQIRKDDQPINDSDLMAWDREFRNAYFDMVKVLHTPPALQNTDGDPMELHKLVFEIDNPETALENLASLCSGESIDTLRSMTEKDKNGMIRKIHFPWTRPDNKKISHFKNTVLGEIRINGNRLTVQVNSARRAKQIRKEIEKRLKKEVRFKLDSIEDIDAVLNHPDQKNSDPSRLREEHDALMKIPEVREQFSAMILKHWDDWMDMKIPALGNKTPRRAIKTEDGRIMVEALLYDIETRKTPDLLLNELHRQGVKKVRKELGLD